MKIIIFIGIIALLVLVGCTRNNEQCRMEEVCVKYDGYEETGEKCLSEIRYHVPPDFIKDNETVTIPMKFNSNDLCYDPLEDPMGLREYVKGVMAEHPNDWEYNINWSTTLDPKVSFINDTNISEVKRVDIREGKKIRKKCVEKVMMKICDYKTIWWGV